MSVPTVELTGSALLGVVPQIARAAAAAAAALPARVKLGRLPGAPRAQVPRLEHFIDRAAGKPPPSRVNWYDRAKRSLGRMYLNDELGCCVISGKAHALGAWTANDSDSGGEVQATDAEIRDQYRRWCGPGDDGCYIAHVLDRCMSEGFTANGRRYQLDAYVRVDHRNVELVKTALHLFGALSIGFSLPADWTGKAVWDVSNSRIVGGHDVTPLGYDEKGVYVSSWGRVYLFTWRAWGDARYIDECYVLLDPTWTNNDRLAPSGVNVAALREAIDVLRGGGVPPIPDDPPPPPVPPVPPPPTPPTVYDLDGVIEGSLLRGRATFRGTATPRPPSAE